MPLISLENIELQLYTDEEVRKIGVVQVTNPSTYDRGLPKANGVNDPRMGVTDKTLQCPTCGLTATCNNHYGFIELEKPVFRLGHISSALSILRCVCWACSRPKFSISSTEGFVDVRSIVNKTFAGSKERLRSISEACKNRFKCPWCNIPQPVYSRVNKVFFDRNFRPKESALFLSEEERQYANRRLFPDEIQSIFRNIPHDALQILGYKPHISHPMNYIFKAHIVPPPSIRPATAASSTEARMRGENDLTVAIQDIVRSNNDLAAIILLGDEEKIQIAWDKLQIFCAALINGNSKNLSTFNGTVVVHARAMGKRKTKVIKDRLTGKKGRLRGNLSGKRVDQAGRTVVGPDASSDIFELGVPSSIMRTLTFPEHVNSFNLQRISECVIRGANAKNGALTVRLNGEKSNEVLHISLLDLNARRALASTLKAGMIVERHLQNGDWVLFNRQPSLHKASIMAFKAYEISGLQFKLPLPCTKPFNADFDGDEMNIHALQDYPAIAEAQEIMAVPHQMVSPQNNSVLIALVQDSIVGAYLMTRKDAFLSRDEAMQLAIQIHYCPNEQNYSELPGNDIRSFVDNLRGFPEPTILKGKHGPLWTGKQIISWALPKNFNLFKCVNDGDPKNIEDIWNEKIVIVRNGILLAGRLCKQTVGSTSGGIVQNLWKLNGPWAAAKFVSDAQRLLMNWLRKDSISISIRDCLCSCEEKIDKIAADAMGKVDDLESAEIPPAIKEIKQTQLLQETLRNVGATALSGMDMTSGIATVVLSGSKGNMMNIAQISGLVGQQTINGSRIAFRKGPKGPRTLANFAPGDNSPEARGFVASSYMMGLQPHEFFFHQQAGREGVVATAVSTADTGYNQRRMVKNQESEVIGYDLSVRVSSNLIVQQHYGGDDYDGSMVERIKIPQLSMPDEESLNSLTCEQTAKSEKKYLLRVLETLKKMKTNIYDNEIYTDVSMPANFLKIVSRLKIGREISSSKKLAKTSDLLSKLLRGIIMCHAFDLQTDNLEELIFWSSRDWRVNDDPSLQARLCLTIQCNTKTLRNEQVYEDEVDELVDSFLKYYRMGIVNPGEGVGAIGSSSIGEPSTQMTLNIFHYSGIAEKNVTLTGLPRFKQIINAVDTYDTANMRVRLFSKDKNDARQFSSKIAKIQLSQIVEGSRIVLNESQNLALKLNELTVNTLTASNIIQPRKISKELQSRISNVVECDLPKLGSRFNSFSIILIIHKSATMSRHISIEDVAKALSNLLGSESVITSSPKWCEDWTIVLRPLTWGDSKFDKISAQAVHDALLETAMINGVDAVKKAVPIFEKEEWFVETEGSNLLDIAEFPEVDALHSSTNNIQEISKIFGVEAALCLMQSELHRVLSFDGSYVDPRHTWLLSDTVARSGSINPLNRHKMEEMGGSLLQCASFEQTLEVFEHGAAFAKNDNLGGATEKLIVGQPVNVGTGSFAILVDEEDSSYQQQQGSFVAPLNCESQQDFDTIFETSERVLPLRISSEPVYDRVLPLHQTANFLPPSDLPHTNFVEENSNYIRLISPLILIMREHAQNILPVWISLEIVPTGDETISIEEFADVENALESYSGWLHKPKRGNFNQFSEIEFDYENKRVVSKIEYSETGIFTTHFYVNHLKKVHFELLQPYDAWSANCSAESRVEILSENLPSNVIPDSVIILQEKIFEKGAWIIRLSKKWFGKNIVEAEQKQRSGSKTCSFHISIELKKPWDLLEIRGSTDLRIGGGFLERVHYILNTIQE